jgi:hypothetical protein
MRRYVSWNGAIVQKIGLDYERHHPDWLSIVVLERRFRRIGRSQHYEKQLQNFIHTKNRYRDMWQIVWILPSTACPWGIASQQGRESWEMNTRIEFSGHNTYGVNFLFPE